MGNEEGKGVKYVVMEETGLWVESTHAMHR